MKISFIFAALSLASLVAGFMPLRERQYSNATTLLTAPDCAARCGELVAQNFACDPSTNCLCTTYGLKASLEACFIAICPGTEVYMAQKVYATVCKVPVRDRSVVTAVTTYVLYALAALFTGARFLSRNSMFGGAGYGWDDYIAFSCFFASTGTLAMLVKVQQNGFGRDMYTLEDPNELSRFLFWFFCVQPIYILVTFGTKISMVLLYLRTWPSSPRSGFGVVCWGAIILLVSTMLASLFATIFQCVPFSYNWENLASAAPHCTDRVTQIYATASINIFYDIMVISIPLPKLMDLDITRAQKIGVMFVFTVGIVVTVCSIVRLRYLSVFGQSINFTYDYSFLGIWSIVEVYTCLVCVCMPAATGFLRRIYDWAVGDVEQDDDLTEGFDMAAHGQAEMAHELEDGSKFSSFTTTKTERMDMEKCVNLTMNRRSANSPVPLLDNQIARSETAQSRIPELRYQDDENSILLEVIHEPHSNEPVRAKLSYVDRQETLHTIEIEGKHPDIIGYY